MSTKIEYKKSVFKDLKNIGVPEAKRIMSQVEKILKQNPNRGIPIKGKFEGLFRLRIGDYRIIYAKTQKGILILKIGHRSKVYK